MSRSRRRIALVAVLGATTALTAAVAAFGAPMQGAATPQRVTVGLSEFKFAVTPKTVRKGVVTTFVLTNRGVIGHDFKIAGKKSPVLAAGRRGTLKVTFRKAGRYAFLCTLPSHAAAGMKGVLVVR